MKCWFDIITKSHVTKANATPSKKKKEPWQINNNATLKILIRIVQREHDSENYQPKSSKKGRN